VVINNIRIDLEPIDPKLQNLPNYGYKSLIALMLESKDFQRMVTEWEEVSGEKMLKVTSLLRGDEGLRRGLAALANLLYNKTATYNPVNETEWKYMDIVLNCFQPFEKQGKAKVWNVDTGKSKFKITSQIEEGQWVYKVAE